MNLINIVGLLLTFVVISGHGKKLPSFMHACSITDPNFGNCSVASGQAAIPFLVKGNPDYQIPNMLPLEIEKIEMQPSSTLFIKFSEIELYGLEDTKLTKFDYDVKNERIRLILEIPRANIKSKYEMKGEVLFVPIEGKGPCNLTFVDGTYDFSFDAVLKERNGKKYVTIVNPKLDCKVLSPHYYFENLFGGSRLGDEMNVFLDEHRHELTDDFRPAVRETINAIITNVATNIFLKVPVTEAFKDFVV